MSFHTCEKCHLTGDVEFKNGVRKAYEAVCNRDDCPQNRNKKFIDEFCNAPPPIDDALRSGGRQDNAA